MTIMQQVSNLFLQHSSFPGQRPDLLVHPIQSQVQSGRDMAGLPENPKKCGDSIPGNLEQSVKVVVST